MKRLVSIIMPAKNAEPFIETCLQSIIQQSYSNWELVVVNDHSTDETLAILQKYAEKERRITFLNNDGDGIIDALNHGYKKAKGEYITRMDADDIMPKNKLGTMVSLCDKNLVITGKVRYISDGTLREGYIYYQDWLNSLADSEAHYSEIYRECVIPSPCWMMHKETFDKIGGFHSETYPEDYELCFRMYQNEIKVVSSKEVMHIWRDHPMRTSRNDDNYADNSFLKLKANFFLKVDHDVTHQLCIWGAGKKAKTLAKLLLEKGVEFVWATENPNKIGKEIYGKSIINPKEVLIDPQKTQLLLLVANKQEQKEIQQKINRLKNIQPFWFC